MAENYEIDNLDLQILKALKQDSRVSFQELARDLKVSGGTIHVRFNKMKEAGIILGSRMIIDYYKLGYTVCSFIGIQLRNATNAPKTIKTISSLPNVSEAHITTGKYSLMLKIYVKDIRELHHFVIDTLSPIEDISSTETIISLENPLSRDIDI